MVGIYCLAEELTAPHERLCFMESDIDIKHTLLPTRLLIMVHVKHTIPDLYTVYKCLPEDEPSHSKHVEGIKIKN